MVLWLPAAGVEPADASGNAGGANQPGTAPSGQAASAETYRRRADDIRREIKNQQKELDTVTRRETDIVTQLDAVEVQIQSLKRNSARLGGQVAELDRQLASAGLAAADLKRRIEANEEYLSRRLVAFYKLNRLGEIHLLASADNVAGFVQRKNALKRILDHDQGVRQELLEHQSELDRLQQLLAADRRQKQAAAADKQRQLELLSQRRKERANLLAEVRRRKDFQLEALQELQRSADRLDRQIAALGHQQTAAHPGAASETRPFPDFKGLLQMPVEGNIINLFGPYRNAEFNVTNFRSGIDIETEKGEPVRAVFTGKILYASWFKGYGNTMIIDHGANYYSVYAHVEEMFKSTGDRVQAGEVIATVGDTGSMGGARLHFEIRHHGKPVDPAPWLKLHKGVIQ